MSHICFETEKHLNYDQRYEEMERAIEAHTDLSKLPNPNHLSSDLVNAEQIISSCAVKASFDIRASLIIVFTHSGLTVRKIAKHKPKCAVLAVSPNEWVVKSLLIHRGIFTMQVGSLVGSNTLEHKVIEEAM